MYTLYSEASFLSQKLFTQISSTNKKYILQWILAYVGITGNEKTNSLAKAGRGIPVDTSFHTNLNDLNAIEKFKNNIPAQK